MAVSEVVCESGSETLDNFNEVSHAISILFPPNCGTCITFCFSFEFYETLNPMKMHIKGGGTTYEPSRGKTNNVVSEQA